MFFVVRLYLDISANGIEWLLIRTVFVLSHSIDLEIGHCYAFQRCIGFGRQPNHADDHEKRLVIMCFSFYTYKMKNIEPVFRIAMMHSALMNTV